MRTTVSWVVSRSVSRLEFQFQSETEVVEVMHLLFYLSRFVATMVKTEEVINIRIKNSRFVFLCVKTFDMTGNATLRFISCRSITWFGLISLFDGISTFVGYLIPKPLS